MCASVYPDVQIGDVPQFAHVPVFFFAASIGEVAFHGIA